MKKCIGDALAHYAIFSYGGSRRRYLVPNFGYPCRARQQESHSMNASSSRTSPTLAHVPIKCRHRRRSRGNRHAGGQRAKPDAVCQGDCEGMRSCLHQDPHRFRTPRPLDPQAALVPVLRNGQERNLFPTPFRSWKCTGDSLGHIGKEESD